MDDNKNVESQEANLKEIEVDNTEEISDGDLIEQADKETTPMQYTPSVSNNNIRNSSVVKKTIPQRKIQIPNNKMKQNRSISMPKKTTYNRNINSNVNSRGTSSFLSNASALVNKSRELNNSLSNGLFNSNDNDKNKAKGSGIVKAIWKKLPLKTKLIIIGVCAAIALTIIFIVVLITPLMNLGLIDIEGISSTSISSNIGYSSISNNNSYWFPIGSSETTVVNGVRFASGEPYTKNLTSYFNSKEGFRTKPHGGIDVGNAGHGPGVINVIATKDGTVVYPTSSSQTSFSDNGYYGNTDGDGFGNYVKIQHNDGMYTIYAHLSKNSITVLSGDTVKQGQVIGKMGHSGSSTATHLHFEVRDSNNGRVDPLNYISVENPRPVKSKPNYVSGNSNEQSVCLALTTTGLPDNAVAAIMTNMYYESSFNPTNIGDNGTSYGLCQWHNGRYDNLRKTYPNSYQTIDSQIEFLMYELGNSYPSIYNSLLDNNNTYNDLTYDFCAKFEIPKDTKQTCKKRLERADTYYNYVQNNCQ